MSRTLLEEHVSKSTYDFLRDQWQQSVNNLFNGIRRPLENQTNDELVEFANWYKMMLAVAKTFGKQPGRFLTKTKSTACKKCL